jgi:hypothetical protein
MDMSNSDVNLEYLQNNLTDKLMPGLEQVIAIKDGQVIPLWPKPKD